MWELHCEDPQQWDAETLSRRFGLTLFKVSTSARLPVFTHAHERRRGSRVAGLGVRAAGGASQGATPLPSP